MREKYERSLHALKDKVAAPQHDDVRRTLLHVLGWGRLTSHSCVWAISTTGCTSTASTAFCTSCRR
jgi:predicted metal-dependent enzyme (double-stranded beta helix superfamily)